MAHAKLSVPDKKTKQKFQVKVKKTSVSSSNEEDKKKRKRKSNYPVLSGYTQTLRRVTSDDRLMVSSTARKFLGDLLLHSIKAYTGSIISTMKSAKVKTMKMEQARKGLGLYLRKYPDLLTFLNERGNENYLNHTKK